MAFSLFRRRSGSPPAAPGTSRGPARPSTPAAGQPELEVSAGAEIEVSSSGSCLPAVVEEAAVLFATGRVEAAIETLHREVERARDGCPADMWYMLFDLYQVLGKRQEFEDLAVDYSVRFERSPPTWPEAAAPAAPARRAAATVVTLSGTLSGLPSRQAGELEAAGRRDGAVSLKCERLQAIDDAGANLLLDVLRRARAQGRRLSIGGAQVLERLLRRVADGDPPGPREYWLLLLELYQAQGRREDFETLCVDYAVSFEVSPPSWEEPVAVPTPAPVLQEAAAGYPAAAEDAYPLRGEICWTSLPQLDELARYAAGRERVVLDMSGVTRIDFASSGMLLNTLSQLRYGGKELVITGANALVAALLCVVGVDRLATVVRAEHR